MSFMDAKFSKWGEVATAVLSQSLAKRFARVMLAAVLAASFLPVAAFADEGGAELKGITGRTSIDFHDLSAYTNKTVRTNYEWTCEAGSTGEIEFTSETTGPRVSFMATKPGVVFLKVSGGDLDYETIEITINKRDIRLTSHDCNKVYDGTPLTGDVAGDVIAVDGVIPEIDLDKINIEFEGSQTDCGTSKNAIRITLDSSIAEYYNITKNEGDLVVTPRPVTLTSASGSKEYDGKPLTNDDVIVGGKGWADGQGATYSFTGSQKIVGSSENTFECIPNEGTNLDNYQINKTYGTLTVTDRSEKYQITLTPNSKSVTYDGTEKSVSGFETLEFQINGQTFYVSGVEASAAGTDAGEYPVKVSGQAVVIDSDGNDVTDQFTVNIDDAKLTIVGVDSDKSASNLPHTGDSAALYAMGICGVAIAAGAGALFTFRKRNNYK